MSTIPEFPQTKRPRLAAFPPPSCSAIPLPCPRCNSNETKFCYYNNYNLAQPRHFCCACRRYWTQGGALRDIPVGGGTRKRSRPSRYRVSPSGSSSSPSSSSTLTSVELLNLNDNVGADQTALSFASMMTMVINSEQQQQQQPAGFLSLGFQQGYGCGGSVVEFGYDAPDYGFDLNTWRMSFADGGLCDWPGDQNINLVPAVGGAVKEEKMTADYSSTSSCCPDQQGGYI